MERKVLEVEFQKVFDRWAWRVTKCELEFDGFGLHVESGIFRSVDEQVHYIPIKNKPEETRYIRFRETLLLNQSEKEWLERGIESINEKYGEKVRWRATFYGFYYYLNGEGEVHCAEETSHFVDDMRYNFGNYFKTEEEAKVAFEKIKKVLLEETEETTVKTNDVLTFMENIKNNYTTFIETCENDRKEEFQTRKEALEYVIYEFERRFIEGVVE